MSNAHAHSLNAHGPVVVAIGGGHGLARSLGAARRYASQITAIVSAADDGGSSGRLRDALGIAAPGDIRRCIGALLPNDTPLGRALEHRFGGGELEGHAFGNLLIAALMETTGDFTSGIEEACRITGAVGEVLPSTSGPVVLKASGNGREIEGQLRITTTGGISQLSVVPPDAPSPKRAIEAILNADQIVIGPGSLYTSVLAALIPMEVSAAVMKSAGQRVYVANLREQVPETAGYDVGRHIETLIAHGITPDVVLADPTGIAAGSLDSSTDLVQAQLAGANGLVHDEVRLAEALQAIALRWRP